MTDGKAKHGLVHWLTVVLIRLIKLIISVVLGAYFFSFGFSLSKNPLLTFFSLFQLMKIEVLYEYVPHFIFLKSKTVDLLNLSSGGLATWWAMVVGIPLMLMGILSLLANFFNLMLALFDYIYSLGHCPWYEWHKLTVEVIKDGRHRHEKQV